MTILEEDAPIIDEAKKYIYSINFDKIINKMVLVDGWIKSDAEKTCELFRKFLFLRIKYPSFKNLVPTKDIDEFFHNFLTDSELYFESCRRLLGEGKFIKHYPYFGIDGVTNKQDLSQAFNETRKLFEKEFATQIYLTRSKFPSWAYWLLKKLT